jgi:ABC-2 family transporter protein
MIWLAWRQFRLPAVAVYAGLAAIGVLAAITGPDLRGRTDFFASETLYYGGLLVLYGLPAIIGVFWGVPAITREIETGTHTLVWNQTITRHRWLATKLAIGVLAAMIAAGVLSLVIGWWASPIDTAASLPDGGAYPPRIEPAVFAARGIVPVGYAVFAYVLGVAVGIVLRRTVTAMAVTLVVFVAVLVAVPYLVRPYLLPATEETVRITAENIRSINGNSSGVAESIAVITPPGVWMLANETVDADGNVANPLPNEVQDCVPKPGESRSGPPPGPVMPCMAQLADLGYQQRLTYHPASHFWPLQWIETGLFLMLSALMAWFCFRRLRHVS